MLRVTLVAERFEVAVHSSAVKTQRLAWRMTAERAVSKESVASDVFCEWFVS